MSGAENRKNTGDKKNAGQNNAGRHPRPFTYGWLIVLLLILILLPFINRYKSGSASISWQVFEQTLLQSGTVEQLEVVNADRVNVYVHPNKLTDSLFQSITHVAADRIPREGPLFYFSIGSVESFERRLDKAQENIPSISKIPVAYKRSSGVFIEIIGWLLPIGLMIFAWSYLLRRAPGGGKGSIFNFGQTTATLLDQESRSHTSFEDVAGLEEAKIEIKETVDFLKDPSQYTRLGAKIPKGIIIVGPPGTGKTLLARAVAGEAKVPFFSISGSEFVEMFVGVGASRVRDLFKKAKEKAPCIIFIDEIDAIGRSRGKNAFYTGANDERESTLNQLLTEMDGFGTNTGVIVLAATNRGDMLDPALLRPGRFDRHIYLDLPTLKERKAIFGVHLRPLVLDESIDVAFLAQQTPGFSGADIANICNEAALIAARNKKNKIERSDFLDAIDRIVAGPEKKSKIISTREKEIIAVHESGHALVSWLLPNVDPLIKVSIVPRGKSLGAAWYLPEEKQLHSYEEMNEQLSVTLGGRAAEEVVFNSISSGAMDDLEKATRLAYLMVTCYGFSKKIGHISYYDSTGARDNSFQRPYSEVTASAIDDEVRQLIQTAYDRSKETLRQQLTALKSIARLLQARELIFKEDIEKILGSRPIAEWHSLAGSEEPGKAVNPETV
jgi:cell division protease FtsH